MLHNTDGSADIHELVLTWIFSIPLDLVVSMASIVSRLTRAAVAAPTTPGACAAAHVMPSLISKGLFWDLDMNFDLCVAFVSYVMFLKIVFELTH